MTTPDDGLAEVLSCTCYPVHGPDTTCRSAAIPAVRAWHEQQTAARIDPDRVADLALRLARAERRLAGVKALHSRFDNGSVCNHSGDSWPCATIRTLEGEEQP